MMLMVDVVYNWLITGLITGVTSSVKERRKGACQRESVRCGAGNCKDGEHKRPRNPDGSGPMYVPTYSVQQSI